MAKEEEEEEEEGLQELLSGIDVNTNGNKEDSDEPRKNNSMYSNGSTTCLHIPKLHHPALSRYLKQQPRC
jgi:hypothetical protein